MNANNEIANREIAERFGIGTVAAAGSAQGSATLLKYATNNVTGADGTKGVILPADSGGKMIRVYNAGSSVLKVYPATGDDINDGTVNVAISVAAKGWASFFGLDATTWATGGSNSQGAALTTQLTQLTPADAAGTPDYAIAAITNSSPFGFSNAAEAITLLYVVQNLQIRVGQLEARLQAAGIIA